METEKYTPFTGKIQTVLLILPFWLLMFYFKDTIARFMVFNLFSLPASGRLGQSLSFFISTLLKIYLLLIFFIFIMALVRSWFPVEKTRERLRALPVFPATLMAGILGVVTPFCSCSAVPLFISFLESGFPLGLTFTFLIASPLVNEIVIIMLAGLFGIRIAILYTLAGLFVAIAAGLLIDRLKLEKFLPEWLLNFHSRTRFKTSRITLEFRIDVAFGTVRDVIRRIWIYVLAGIMIGAAIHGYVPESWLARSMTGNHWFALPMALIAGIPLYACSASVAPIAFALVDKGLPLGVALVFVMAVAGLSLPELIMLRKVLTMRLLITFAGIVFTGILMVGTVFYWLL
jgi:uncharacterized membrane protein YraQ (UPF0718 family)